MDLERECRLSRFNADDIKLLLLSFGEATLAVQLRRSLPRVDDDDSVGFGLGFFSPRELSDDCRRRIDATEPV